METAYRVHKVGQQLVLFCKNAAKRLLSVNQYEECSNTSFTLNIFYVSQHPFASCDSVCVIRANTMCSVCLVCTCTYGCLCIDFYFCSSISKWVVSLKCILKNVFTNDRQKCIQAKYSARKNFPHHLQLLNLLGPRLFLIIPESNHQSLLCALIN